MADNIFTQLGKLFQSNVVIRKKEDGKLMVKDLEVKDLLYQIKVHFLYI